MCCLRSTSNNKKHSLLQKYSDPYCFVIDCSFNFDSAITYLLLESGCSFTIDFNNNN